MAYRTAAAEKTVAGLDKSIARSALLPGVVYHNSYIYTKPGQQSSTNTEITGTTSTPIFIANNSVHEYISQGVVTETIGVAGIANYRRLSAEAEASAARQEVARRGLVATVIGNYYGVLAAEGKLTVAQRSTDEARASASSPRSLRQAAKSPTPMWSRQICSSSSGSAISQTPASPPKRHASILRFFSSPIPSRPTR